MTIKENIETLRSEIPAGVTLIAVSKTYPVEAVAEAYDAGQRLFGENRPQEMTAKQAQLPDDIRWHMIGNLQTNKVKYIAPYVAMIESVSSERLLNEIEKEALKNNRVIDILLEVHIAEEESKMGWDAAELRAYLSTEKWKQLRGVRFCGVMGMATFTDNRDQVCREFRSLRILFDELRGGVFAGRDEFCEVSMGMSGDWREAVEQGSTIVRIGTAIFGKRNYNL